MRTALTFGRVSGIPLKIHLNWFLTAVLVTWSLAVGYFPLQYPDWTHPTYWMVAVLTALLFFGSVLLHELGHSLVAQREGVPVKSITLFIFGGVAHIGSEPPTAGSEFRIVAAGPLTSLVLSAVFYVIGLWGVLGSEMSSAALYLSQMNLILAVFNMIPGFPLDGGRILRSVIWKTTQDFVKATYWASLTGIGIALLFIGLGIVIMYNGDVFSGVWVAFIGGYLGLAAREGYRQAKEYELIFEDYFVDEDSVLVDAVPGQITGRSYFPQHQLHRAASYASTFVLSGLARRPQRLSPLIQEPQPCEIRNQDESYQKRDLKS